MSDGDERCDQPISGLYGAETVCQRIAGHALPHKSTDGIWRDRAAAEQAERESPLMVMEAHTYTDCPDRAHCWANTTHDHFELIDVRAALAVAERKVRAVERVHCWTNEDGKRFMFADDVAAALEIPGT